jgi:hypothetical protein
MYIDGPFFYWILDLLLFGTQFTDHHNTASCVSPAVPWQRLLTDEVLQLHAFKSSPNGGSLPTASFLHRLPCRTDSVVPIVFLRTPLHGPSRKHHYQRYLYCCMRIRFAGTCLLSRCLEANVVSEPFASNSSFSVSTDLSLSKFAILCLTNVKWGDSTIRLMFPKQDNRTMISKKCVYFPSAFLKMCQYERKYWVLYEELRVVLCQPDCSPD